MIGLMIEATDVEMSIPEDVIRICKTLKSHGFQGYIVGGATRDLLRDIIPNDWDITTDAKPDEISEIFEKGFRIIKTGVKYGTVTVKIRNIGYELTTFRVDGIYSDGRRPDKVEYTTDLREDLIRRDFTMNAIAYDPIEKHIVAVDKAMDDIKNGIISAIGDPIERFIGSSGDALRMLRACRFASTEEFKIDTVTLDAIRSCADHINNCSAERIRDEIIKILLSNKPSIAFNHMRDTGLLEIILPELHECIGIEQPGAWHKYDVYGHTMVAVDSIDNESLDKDRCLIIRLIALLHDIGKPPTREWHPENNRFRFIDHEIFSTYIATDILERLSFSNDIIKKVLPVIEDHMMALRVVNSKMSNRSIRKMINRIGEENLDNLFLMSKADVIGSGTDIENGLNRIELLKEKINQLSAENNGKTELVVNTLEINGYDIMEMGVEKGPMVGRVLNQLHEMVLEDPGLNDKDILIDLALKYLYCTAFSIYLKHAYPDNEEIRLSKMAMLDNPGYFSDGIPSESRFGCHVNGHMKLRFKQNRFFSVDKNDMPDSIEVKEKCRRIKQNIENEWKSEGLPVYTSKS